MPGSDRRARRSAAAAPPARTTCAPSAASVTGANTHTSRTPEFAGELGGRPLAELPRQVHRDVPREYEFPPAAASTEAARCHAEGARRRLDDPIEGGGRGGDPLEGREDLERQRRVDRTTAQMRVGQQAA